MWSEHFRDITRMTCSISPSSTAHLTYARLTISHQILSAIPSSEEPIPIDLLKHSAPRQVTFRSLKKDIEQDTCIRCNAKHGYRKIGTVPHWIYTKTSRCIIAVRRKVACPQTWENVYDALVGAVETEQQRAMRKTSLREHLNQHTLVCFYIRLKESISWVLVETLLIRHQRSFQRVQRGFTVAWGNP